MNSKTVYAKTDQGIHQLHRIDDKPIIPNKEEIRLFSCVRNELCRLPFFIDYHLKKGVDRFFFVDNDSTDESVNFLLSQPNVHVYSCKESYAASRCGIDWINELLRNFGTGHWILALDADELFLFPYCEYHDYKELSHYLENERVQGFETFMLDMYSDLPIIETKYIPGSSFIDICPYFDINNYEVSKSDRALPVRGGVRERLFWKDQSSYDVIKPPVLHKIPFVRWEEDFEYLASTHQMSKIQLSNTTGIILHFKFFSDFIENVFREIERKEHWDGAKQYQIYSKSLESNRNVTLYSDASVKFLNTQQLIDLGLMKITSSDYLN